MLIDQYHNDADGKVTFTRFQASDFAKQIVHIKQDVIKHGELPAPIKQIIARFAGHEAWRVGVSIPDPLISTFEKCSNCAGTKQFFVRILENGKMFGNRGLVHSGKLCQLADAHLPLLESIEQH